MVKETLRPANVSMEHRQGVLQLIRDVMATDHRTYVYNLPLPTQEKVYISYPLEDAEGGALLAAHRKYEQIMKSPRNTLSDKLQKRLREEIKGVLPQTLQ
jgi:hypothetical protein